MLKLTRGGVAWSAVGCQMGAFAAAVACAKERVQFGRPIAGLLGGKGILIDRDVVRYFNDAEALYSYEGTRKINHLIVGRALTGHSALV